MSLTKRLFACLAAGVVAVCTASASAADPALTFSFSELAGDFSDNGGSWLFTAADHADPNATSGDVTRQAPFGLAAFDGTSPTGFFSLDMTISPKGGSDPDNFLSGDGVLTITDVDGDTIQSNAVSGVWINNGSALFVGNIQDLVITSNDGEFNGASRPAPPVSLNGLTGPLPDDTFNLFTMTLGNWFTNGGGSFAGFSNAPTLAQGSIVPEPATLCLLAFGTLVMAGRWRRKA